MPSLRMSVICACVSPAPSTAPALHPEMSLPMMHPVRAVACEHWPPATRLLCSSERPFPGLPFFLLLTLSIIALDASANCPYRLDIKSIITQTRSRINNFGSNTTCWESNPQSDLTNSTRSMHQDHRGRKTINTRIQEINVVQPSKFDLYPRSNKKKYPL